MQSILRSLLHLIPKGAERKLFSAYHLFLAYIGALYYRFPGRKMIVIGVTGTKGKTTTTEILHAIFEAAGKKTLLTNTIRFKVGNDSVRNLRKMSMPGRFFIQSMLARSASEGAEVAILEMTSEGAVQHRHRFTEMDALVFTNLAPEHIESHGSFEAYGNAKLLIGEELERSRKRPRIIVAPSDDPWGKKFLEKNVEKKIGWVIHDASPASFDASGISLTVDGVRYQSPLPGEANIKNALGAILLTRALGISPEDISSGLQKLSTIPGRFENVNEHGDFPVVIDYAHTPESLEEVYKAFSGRRICVLGATGGGRDTWKRPVFGKIAERYCDEIFLTNEDPYDEEPAQIIEDIAKGMEQTPTIIADRREAIREAIRHAQKGDAVLVTGKGTDPYIMGPHGSKIPWSDADIAREALRDK